MFSYNDKSMPAVAGIVLMRLDIWIILAAAFSGFMMGSMISQSVNYLQFSLTFR
jgi:hypothetical protein